MAFKCSRAIRIRVVLLYGYNVLLGQAQSDKVQSEIKTLETKNASTSDVNVLSRIIADEYVMIGVDGAKRSKTDIIGVGTKTGISKVTVQIGDIKSFQDSAVVVGTARITSPEGGDIEVNYSNV
jgi:hypothetical protein